MITLSPRRYEGMEALEFSSTVGGNFPNIIKLEPIVANCLYSTAAVILATAIPAATFSSAILWAVTLLRSSEASGQGILPAADSTEETAQRATAATPMSTATIVGTSCSQ